MGRAPCCDKANVKKGPWSPEEDAKLKAYIEKHGTGGNWIALPQKIGLKRCGKSCRLRWLNYLRPNIKHGGFTEEEDNIICSLYISIGSRWSIIAAQLPGRTDNDIKNYWNTRLKKKLLGRSKQSSSFNNNPKDRNELDDSNALSNSALERLQLHLQLQSLQNQNPLSFYNNPALWPTKLYPLMTGISTNSNKIKSPELQNHEFSKLTVPPSTGTSLPQDQDQKINSSSQVDMSVPFMATGNNPIDSNKNIAPVRLEEGVHQQQFDMGNTQQLSALQAELHEIISNNNRSMGYNMPQDEDQVADFDCFAEMNGSKDSTMMWWSNDLMAKSTSSSSWGSSTSTSTPVLQAEGMFQDNYELVGYSL